MHRKRAPLVTVDFVWKNRRIGSQPGQTRQAPRRRCPLRLPVAGQTAHPGPRGSARLEAPLRALRRVQAEADRRADVQRARLPNHEGLGDPGFGGLQRRRDSRSGGPRECGDYRIRGTPGSGQVREEIIPAVEECGEPDSVHDRQIQPEIQLQPGEP